MTKPNSALRAIAKKSAVPLWAIALEMKVSEQTLIRKWRKELDEDEKQNILSIIKKLREA